MKLTIKSNDLAAAATVLAGVVRGRSTLPILSNVLVVAAGETLSLTTTDLNIAVNCRLAADIKTDGSTTIIAAKLFEIANRLPDCDLQLATDDKQVTAITSPLSSFDVNGLSAAEFPSEVKLVKARKFSISQATLKTMLRRTEFAMSVQDERYIMCAILFEIKNGSLRLVATDGRRLALDSAEVDAESCEFILPTAAVRELARLLGTDDGKVEVLTDGNHAQFSTTDGDGMTKTMTAKLLEGNYPNYRQVIPQEFKHAVTLDRAALLAAVRRVDLMTSATSWSIRLDFKPGALTVSTKSNEVGTATETVEATGFKGKPLTIAFQPRYLTEVLSALAEKTVTMDLIDELTSARIRGTDSFYYILMPMRVS